MEEEYEKKKRKEEWRKKGREDLGSLVLPEININFFFFNQSITSSYHQRTRYSLALYIIEEKVRIVLSFCLII